MEWVKTKVEQGNGYRNEKPIVSKPRINFDCEYQKEWIKDLNVRPETINHLLRSKFIIKHIKNIHHYHLIISNI